jgi:hypothetical protein
MYGIVTIVDGVGLEQIEVLWAELRAEYGDAALEGFSLPHMTYHVADDYDLDGVRALLERLAEAYPAFTAPMRMIGALVGEAGMVTSLVPTRTPQLSALHEALWAPASELGTNVIDRYAADGWTPHVSLAYEPAILGAAPRIAEAMRGGRLPTTLEVDNLSVIEEQPYGHDRVIEVPLRR